jgi:hypothetical protein
MEEVEKKSEAKTRIPKNAHFAPIPLKKTR